MKQKINGKVVREFHKLDRLWIYWEKKVKILVLEIQSQSKNKSNRKNDLNLKLRFENVD